MELTNRELWGLIHGMGFGALFLLAFAGGLAGLYSLRPELLTVTGLRERMTRLVSGTWLMANPWYRAAAPKGADLTAYPRSFLLANPNLAEWHNFGMEWKEHVAWFAPILATVVAFVVLRYGKRLADDPFLRKTLIVTFVLAFGAAAVAGLMGALITKAAPIH